MLTRLTSVAACGWTNRHIEIHGNLLEDSGVITMKSEWMDNTKLHE